MQEWETLEELQDNIILRSADPRELYNRVKPHLNYSIEYAEDRVENIKENWDEDLYVDSVSSKQFIRKQIKTTDDWLSESEGSLTNHLDKIANYILYCPFDNEEEKQRHLELKEEQKEAKKIADKNRRAKKEQEIRDEQKNRLSLITNSRRSKTKIQTLYLEDPNQNKWDIEPESDSHIEKVFYTYEDKELNQKKDFKNNERYWKHFGQHNYSTIGSIFDIDYGLRYYQLAYQDLAMKQEGLDSLKERVEEVTSPPAKKQLESLMRENRAEYNFVAEQLRNRVVFKSSAPAKDKDILTMIEDKIDYTNTDIIKVLLYNYAELKLKYENKTSSLYWDMLMDMENFCTTLFGKGMTDTKAIIVNYVLKTPAWSYDELIDEIEFYSEKRLSRQVIVYHLNSIIKSIASYNETKEKKLANIS